LEVAEKGRKAKKFCLENRNPILIMILADRFTSSFIYVMRVES
jgi:hypothetical protein